jgi:hypothetical protein
VLQGGAIAAGMVWTAPVARTIRLGETPGSPAPTSPTEVTVTEPTYDTSTTTSTTTTSRPDNPSSPCDLRTRSGCHTVGGSFDVVFEFRRLRPGRALRFELTFLEGSTAAAATLFGTADDDGICEFTPDRSFANPWSAVAALLDHASGATLLKGTFAVRRRCSSGEFSSH